MRLTIWMTIVLGFSAETAWAMAYARWKTESRANQSLHQARRQNSKEALFHTLPNFHPGYCKWLGCGCSDHYTATLSPTPAGQVFGLLPNTHWKQWGLKNKCTTRYSTKNPLLTHTLNLFCVFLLESRSGAESLEERVRKFHWGNIHC